MAKKKKVTKVAVAVGEKPAKKAASKAAKNPAKGGSRKKRRSKRPPVSAAKIKLLALEYESMTAADAAIDAAMPLAEMMRIWPSLAAAWERGRFLGNLKDMAATAATVAESEQAMGIETGRLKETLEKDKEAADIWNSTRLDVTIAVKLAMVERAKEGKPAAAKHIERVLLAELARGSADFRKISISQMTELTGKTRQTIHEWVTQYGLKRNSDKTFDLAEFVGWFEGFCLRKAAGGSAATPADPLKAARAEKLQIDLKMQKGQMLDRSVVISGIIARHQILVNTLARKSDELSLICHGQPTDKIAGILEGFFTDLRRQMCDVPEQLRLDERSTKRFTELIEDLEAQGEKN